MKISEIITLAKSDKIPSMEVTVSEVETKQGAKGAFWTAVVADDTGTIELTSFGHNLVTYQGHKVRFACNASGKGLIRDDFQGHPKVTAFGQATIVAMGDGDPGAMEAAKTASRATSGGSSLGMTIGCAGHMASRQMAAILAGMGAKDSDQYINSPKYEQDLSRLVRVCLAELIDRDKDPMPEDEIPF